jgi:hypothetical protein
LVFTFQAERLISIAAWPCAIIEDAGTPTGFVMLAIPDEFYIELTNRQGGFAQHRRNPAPAQSFVGPGGPRHHTR